jgi:hypothetical protein
MEKFITTYIIEFSRTDTETQWLINTLNHFLFEVEMKANNNL